MVDEVGLGFPLGKAIERFSGPGYMRYGDSRMLQER